MPPDFARKLLVEWRERTDKNWVGKYAPKINLDVLKSIFGDDSRGRGERRKGQTLEE